MEFLKRIAARHNTGRGRRSLARKHPMAPRAGERNVDHQNSSRQSRQQDGKRWLPEPFGVPLLSLLALALLRRHRAGSHIEQKNMQSLYAMDNYSILGWRRRFRHFSVIAHAKISDILLVAA